MFIFQQICTQKDYYYNVTFFALVSPKKGDVLKMLLYFSSLKAVPFPDLL